MVVRQRELSVDALEIDAPSLGEDAIEIFRADVQVFLAAYEQIREKLGIPVVATQVVLSDDFAAEVDRRTKTSRRALPFTLERVGGLVGARSLPQRRNGSEVAVVFDASLRKNATANRPLRAHIVAHELAHRLIDRSRIASGSLKGVKFPSRTGTEIARSSARMMIGEYQADWMAHLLVSTYIKSVIEGESRPYVHWHAEGSGYLELVEQTLRDAHQRWRSVVNDHREQRLTLDAMFYRLAGDIHQTLTLLVHAQASADAATAGRNVLDHPPVAALPAVQLYLAKTFPPFLDELRAVRQIPNLEGSRQIEARAVSMGAEMNLAIWRRLGLNVTTSAIACGRLPSTRLRSHARGRRFHAEVASVLPVPAPARIPNGPLVAGRPRAGRGSGRGADWQGRQAPQKRMRKDLCGGGVLRADPDHGTSSPAPEPPSLTEPST